MTHLTTDKSLIDEYFAEFKKFVEAKSDGGSFSSFAANWYTEEQEGYKSTVYKEAREVLRIKNWYQSEIGSGAIARRVLSAIELETNNLVQWKGKWGEKSRPQSPLRDAYETRGRLEEFETVLFEHFTSDSYEKSFSNLIALFGKKYDLIGYLYFLKDKSRFLPIAPTTFDKSFEKLGIDLKTAHRASWENYSEYLNSVGQCRRFLSNEMEVEITLLDAHSFLWILSHQMAVENALPEQTEMLRRAKLRKQQQSVKTDIEDQGRSDQKHKKILRIKNVTHSLNKTVGKTAYLNIKTKEFDLHWPTSKKGHIANVSSDEIIILYQRIEGKRYFTHLVQPVDDEMIETGDEESFKFGRCVKVIAFTGEEGKIPFEKAQINLQNRGFGIAAELHGMFDDEELEEYQIKIWNLFQPFVDPELIDNSRYSQITLNDELSEDYESEEGRLLFKKHRSYERDSKLTFQKKKIAKDSGSLFCEVCSFSFETVFGQDYIECHHRVPISEGVRTNKLEDLALVCSNCHRMLHRRFDGKFLSVEELGQLLRNKDNAG